MNLPEIASNLEFNTFNGFVFWMWALAALLLALVPFVWVYRKRTGGKALIILLIALVIWVFFSGMEYLSADLASKVFWLRFTYIGVSMVPTCSLLVSRIFLSEKAIAPTAVKILLVSLPILTMIVAFTNAYHGLMWSRIGPDIIDNVPDWEYGPWFYVWVLYAYLSFAGSLGIVIRAIIIHRGIYRTQAIGMLIALLPPWIIDALFIFSVDLGAINYYYSTPLASGISAVLIVANLMLFRYLQQVPVARTQVLDSMNQGVMVTDEHYVILDVNSALCGMLQVSRRDLLGKNLMQDFPSLNEHRHALYHLFLDGSERSHTFYEEELGYISVKVSGVIRRGVQKPAWVILVEDINELTLAEQALRNAHHRLQEKVTELEQAQDAIKSIGEIVPICARCGRKIQQEDGTWIAVDKFIEEHSPSAMTHGICPACLSKL